MEKYNGKGYDEYGNMIYELKNCAGKVKEYNNDGELIFEGIYLNGEKWNGIKYTYDDIGELFSQIELIKGDIFFEEELNL